MTIIVAAIGKDEDSKEVIVFATDHMITLPTIGQFEMTVEKYKIITPNTIAMLSGEQLIFDDLIKNCTNCSLEETKRRIKANMIQIKNDRLRTFLDTYKMTFQDLVELLKSPVLNPFMSNMVDAISKFTLNTGILLIGFEEEKAQITEINEVRIADVRDLGFDAIGSGGLQATNTLLFQRHSKNDSLPTTIYNVYKSKRNAEVAVGVGKETDMIVLFKTGMVKISEEEIKTLSQIYDKELRFGKNHKKVYEIVTSLKDREKKC